MGDSGGGGGGIIDYICQTSSDALNDLYADRYTCLAVFRSLSRVSKQCICRLLALCPGQVVHESVLRSWIRHKSLALYAAMLAECRRLHVLVRVRHSDDELVLNETFHRALYESMRPTVALDDAAGAESGRDPKAPTPADLVQTAERRWEILLHFMVRSGRYPLPSKPVQNLIRDMGLVCGTGPTSAGFKFLFKELFAQLWIILIGYIQNVERRKMNRNEVLSILFRLGFLELGKGYPVHVLTKSQRVVIADLVQFGLVWHEAGSQYYYPTRLAISLSSGQRQKETTTGAAKDCYIIVETTFKVYAYTTSLLQIAILNMFVGLEAKLPNVVVGRITKKTVSKALQIGITADEIIAFLRDYAHQASISGYENAQNVVRQAMAPPDNVADQIRLWESERNRLKPAQAALFRQFKDRQEYEALLSYAAAQEFVLWRSDEKMMFVTGKEHIESIRVHINQLRAAGNTGPATAASIA